MTATERAREWIATGKADDSVCPLSIYEEEGIAIMRDLLAEIDRLQACNFWNAMSSSAQRNYGHLQPRDALAKIVDDEVRETARTCADIAAGAEAACMADGHCASEYIAAAIRDRFGVE